MIVDGEAELVGDGRLALLDAGVHELLDPAAVQTHDMVVVGALVELEDCHPVFEMMARDESRGLKLRQYPVDRCQPDVLVRFEQCAVDVLGREVPGRAALEYLQDLEARQRYFQAGFAQVLAFHAAPPHRAALRRGASQLCRDQVS
jgi:hypothetical protein